MSKTTRMSLADAVKLAPKAGIRVKQKWDGHWMFFLPGPRAVSVADGRKDTIVPPHLRAAIERALAAKESV